MLRHYFFLAVRNLSKQWLISIINILGLGFGIAICIMVYLYVSHETSFDNFHKNGDRIYRLLGRYVLSSGEVGYSRLHCPEIIEGFPEDIAAVENALPISGPSSGLKGATRISRNIYYLQSPISLKCSVSR